MNSTMIKLSKSEEEEIRREDKSKIDWYDISRNFILQEDFIREFSDKVDWDYISFYQKLSESFIEEFKDEVYWHWISSRQVLSEKFLEKFYYKVNWWVVLCCQKLSEKFISNLIEKDDFDHNLDYALINSKNLTSNLIKHPALNSLINFNKIPLCYFNDLNHPKEWKTFF
jgi:hypothetical protein